MTRTSLVIGTVVGLAVLLTGCHGSPVAPAVATTAALTTSPSAQASSAASRALVPLPAGSVSVLTRPVFTDPGIGGRFVPPSPKSQPRLDAGAAWVAFQRSSAGSSLIGQPFTMVLAEYSNNVQGPVPTVDTVSTRAYSRPRLTWLLVWRFPESAIRRGGPVPVPGSTPPARTYTRTDCGFEDMIDATTGRYQGAFSGCGSSLVSVAPQISWGVLTGRLAAVGGPAPGTPRPLPGTVLLRSTTGAMTVVDTTAAGTFSVALPAGRYAVTGSSPLYGDGTGVCQASTAVTLTPGAPAHIDVYCQEV